jgi:hypothetical protein
MSVMLLREKADQVQPLLRETGLDCWLMELGVPSAAGFIGLEEDVLVTAQGCVFLSSFPREPILV